MNKALFLLCVLLLIAVAVARIGSSNYALTDSQVEEYLQEVYTESAEDDDAEESEATPVTIDSQEQPPITGGRDNLNVNGLKAILLQKVALDELNRQRAKCGKKPIVDLNLISVTQQLVKGELFRLTVEIAGEQFSIQLIERIGAVHRLAPEQGNWEENLFIRKIKNSKGRIVHPCKLRLDATEKKSKPATLKVIHNVNKNRTASWMATLYDREFSYGALPPTPSSDQELNEYLSTLSDQITIPTSYDVRTDSAYAGCKALRAAPDQKTCGSCWSFATTNVLSIRLCKQIKTYPDLANVDLSEQDLISCTPADKPGCSGGNMMSAVNVISSQGVRTELFAPYAALDASNGGPKCQAFGDKRSPYYKSVSSPTYMITRTATNDADRVKIIQQEILKNGPVYAAFTVYEDFHAYKGGIYTVQSQTTRGAHAVALIGWGVENDVPFWIAMNSWGPKWGENGFFRILRGKDVAGIESKDISVGSLVVPTITCKNFAAGATCKNGGERFQNTDGTCGCKCPLSASGTYCETCANCQNGGTKTTVNGMCACTCPKGAFGDICESVFKVTKVDCPADKSITISISINSGSVEKADPVVVAWGASNPIDPVTYPNNIPVKSTPCASGCTATPKTIQLVVPGNPWGYQTNQDFWLYVWKSLGTNEFGASRGYAASYSQIVNRAMCGKTF